MKRTTNLLLFLIISAFVVIQTAEQYITIPAFDIPMHYKLYFDNAVAAQNIDMIIALLTSEVKEHEELRNNYPLAMKLYRILIAYSPGEDFTAEARYIPIKTIIDVSRELAQAGGNDSFLRNMPR